MKEIKARNIKLGDIITVQKKPLFFPEIKSEIALLLKRKKIMQNFLLMQRKKIKFDRYVTKILRKIK